MGVGGGDAVVEAPTEEAGKDGVKRPWWRVRLSRLAVLLWVLVSAALWTILHWHFRHGALRKAEEGLISMCEERARMLQDQFAVSVNHVHALAILVATFHYEKPPALDQVRLPRRPTPPASSLLETCFSASGVGFCSAAAVNCVSPSNWQSYLLVPLP
jgi:hypothetical protein